MPQALSSKAAAMGVRMREKAVCVMCGCYHALAMAQARMRPSTPPELGFTMDEKEFAAHCQQELALIEAAVEAAADESDIDFEMQGGILEVECADGSKVIISPHAIAKEIWVAAKSGGFHFRYDPVVGHWVDTRTGEALRARLVEILKQQGQVALDLA